MSEEKTDKEFIDAAITLINKPWEHKNNDVLLNAVNRLLWALEREGQLKTKIVEVSCLRHVIRKGDLSEEIFEAFEDSFDELEELANGKDPLPNLFPVDELEELQTKVRELIAMGYCQCGECATKGYPKMWAELKELVIE